MAMMKEMKKRLSEAVDIDKIKIEKVGKDKITLDLNADGEPEAALIDTNGTGYPDLLALDLTGDHKFNLYLDDTDENKFPDVMYIDKNGDGNVQLLSVGEEIKGSFHKNLVEIFAVLTGEDSGAEEINKALHELAKTVKEIQAKAANRKA